VGKQTNKQTKQNKAKQSKTKQTNQQTNKHAQQKTPHWVKHLTTPSKGVQGLAL